MKKKALIITGSLITAALLFVLAGLLYFHAKYNLMQQPGEQPSVDMEVEPSDSSGEEDLNASISELEQKDSIAAQGDVMTDEEVMNILLIGTDERTPEFSTNARGDSCMLLSVNKKTGNITLVSFERGTGVPILSGDYEGQWDWLTHTFRYGGAELMMQEISECYKIDVERYVRVNFNTFTTAIDAIDGIDIDLTQAEAEYINDRSSLFGRDQIDMTKVQTVTAGINHINGNTSLVYARCRQIDNDWHRVVRQRNVVKAAMNQVKTRNLKQLDELLDTVLPLVQTNLTEAEIIGLMPQATKILFGNTQQATLPLEGTYGSMVGMSGRSLFAVDFETNANYLHELIYGEKN